MFPIIHGVAGSLAVVGFGVQNHALSQQGSDSSSFVMAKPSGVAEGHLMLSIIGKDDDFAITPPGGWNAIVTDDDGTTVRFRADWKEAGGAEPDDYTFTGDLEEWVGAILRITGHKVGDPINVAAVATGNSSTPTCPDVTTWADGCEIIRAFAADDDDITVDSGYPASHDGIFVNESSSGTGTCSAGAAKTTQATKGATGTAAFSLTLAEGWVAATIAITPAGASWPGNYFGSGADGAKTVSTNETLTATQDGDPVIKHYSSLTINSTKSLTTNSRNKGLVIYVTGDCTINGTLKMDARGASGNPSEDFDLSRFETGGAGGGTGPDPLLPDESNQPQGGGGAAVFTRYFVNDPGSAGGAAQTTGGANGNAGSAAGADRTGGGGGAGASGNSNGGAGSSGTAWGGWLCRRRRSSR